MSRAELVFAALCNFVIWGPGPLMLVSVLVFRNGRVLLGIAVGLSVPAALGVALLGVGQASTNAWNGTTADPWKLVWTAGFIQGGIIWGLFGLRLAYNRLTTQRDGSIARPRSLLRRTATELADEWRTLWR